MSNKYSTVGGRGKMALCVAGLLVLALGGCREEEQDRPLMYEKGTYQGKTDNVLTADEARALQERGNMQKF